MKPPPPIHISTPHVLPVGQHTILNELPAISIQGGQLCMERLEKGVHTLGVVHLSGGGRPPRPQVPGDYHFAFQQ